MVEIGRIVEKRSSTNGGIKSATIDFEHEFAYGYLSGEAGVHYIINSKTGSAVHEVQLSSVLKSRSILFQGSYFLFQNLIFISE